MPKKQQSRSRSKVRAQLTVAPIANGWTVTTKGSARKTRIYATKREAETAARAMLSGKRGGEVIVQGRDGRIRSVDSFVLGDVAAKMISAIEGIRISKDVDEDLRELDRQNLTPKQRRAWLVSKYTKSS